MISIHWTHSIRIKKLFKEGYTPEELSIMYKLPYWRVELITQGLQKPERI